MTIEEQEKQLDFAIKLYTSSADINDGIYAAELIYQVLKKKEILEYTAKITNKISFEDISNFMIVNKINKGVIYVLEALSYEKLKIILKNNEKYIILNPNYKEDAD